MITAERLFFRIIRYSAIRDNSLIEYLLSLEVSPSDHMVFYLSEAASFDRIYNQQNKAMHLINVCEIRKDNDALGYGCDFTEWQESLGYMVADNKLTQDYLNDLIIEYLEEITFFGMDPEQRAERLNEVYQSLDKDKFDMEKDRGIPADEFMKQLSNKYGWPIDEKDEREDELKTKITEAEVDYLRYCHRRERRRILKEIDDQETAHKE